MKVGGLPSCTSNSFQSRNNWPDKSSVCVMRAGMAQSNGGRRPCTRLLPCAQVALMKPSCRLSECDFLECSKRRHATNSTNVHVKKDATAPVADRHALSMAQKIPNASGVRGCTTCSAVGLAHATTSPSAIGKGSPPTDHHHLREAKA